MYPHKLPPLDCEYDSLEPYIDSETMHYHHDKHHQAYVDNLNKALEKYLELQELSIEELIKNSDLVPAEIRTTIARNAGQHYNHSFFFSILKKEIECKGEILFAINKKFGSFENFKRQFSGSATTLFGSGWVWLILNNNELEIMQTPNHETPLTQNKKPLLVIDVWEHAYYLKYKNERKRYIEAFFNIINWNKVNELFNN